MLAEEMGLKKSDVARLAVKRFIEENMDNEQARGMCRMVQAISR